MERFRKAIFVIGTALLVFGTVSCNLLNGNEAATEEAQFMPVEFFNGDTSKDTYYLMYNTDKKTCPTDNVWKRADYKDGDTTDETNGTYVVGNKYTYSLGTTPTAALYTADTPPSATTTGLQFAGWYSENGTLFENFNTDGIWFKSGYSFSYTASGYKFYSRYNKTKSVKPALGDIAIERESTSRTTASVNFITLTYSIAPYAPAYSDTAEHFAGVAVYNGEVYTTDTPSAAKSTSTIIMGLNGITGIRWATVELPQNSFEPSTLKLDRALDMTGKENYSAIKSDYTSGDSKLNIDPKILEAFTEAGKYATENSLTQPAFSEWYLPSAIEFETYLNGTKFATAISAATKAGGSITSSGGFWTSSLDQVREHNYHACWYSTSQNNIQETSVTEEKSVVFFLQIADPS